MSTNAAQTQGPATETEAAEFTHFFADAWAIGATDAERFLATIESRLAPDARLIQPLMPTGIGPRGLRELFTPVFRAIPDLRSRVRRFGATEDGVLIEHTLSGTLGGKRLEWTAVDRFILRDGLIAERHAYYDPLPVAGAMLTRPRASIKLLPGMIRRRRR